MITQYTYHTTGSHCPQIDVTLEDGIIREVFFHGGCNGNVRGLSQLVPGMKATHVIERLKGTPCIVTHNRTSCPDQLAQALQAALEQEKIHAGMRNGSMGWKG